MLCSVLEWFCRDVEVVITHNVDMLLEKKSTG